MLNSDESKLIIILNPKEAGEKLADACIGGLLKEKARDDLLEGEKRRRAKAYAHMAMVQIAVGAWCELEVRYEANNGWRSFARNPDGTEAIEAEHDISCKVALLIKMATLNHEGAGLFTVIHMRFVVPKQVKNPNKFIAGVVMDFVNSNKDKIKLHTNRIMAKRSLTEELAAFRSTLAHLSPAAAEGETLSGFEERIGRIRESNDKGGTTTSG